jgi:hypothetical protein
VRGVPVLCRVQDYAEFRRPVVVRASFEKVLRARHSGE